MINSRTTVNFAAISCGHGPCLFQTYVPKVSGSEKYRTYLSLMPEDVEGGAGGNGDKHDEDDKRSLILSEFRALSYEEQMNQRIQ